MIPLKDSARPQRFPYVNITLIIITIAVFIYQLGLGQRGQVELFFTYGVVPKHFLILLRAPWRAGLWLPLFSSIFLHGGWFHLLGNMLYLWVFGDNVEDKMGHAPYLLFYLVAGAAGGLTHVFLNIQSTMPTIGASGAIAGILGAYLFLVPRSKVLTLIPIGFFLTTVEVPGTLFLFLWFFLQVINAFVLISPGAQAVAWGAHIGGFIFGLITGIAVRLRKRKYLF
jgi:membrane associated rhomboid family serine protease